METSSPTSPGAPRPMLHDMEIRPPMFEDPSSSALWDWGDLLDFTVDDQFPISFDSVDDSTNIEVNHIEATPVPDRVRKRDPRLTCSNFLAGRVPCACPELDEKLEEEEVVPGKKRARTTRSTAGVARCQVPGCEADISELKGYHKRHRVCLRCANASSVVLDGESKRYCQQCGKFHLLSDFDEGKRSCRRKLERHNNRRRRKSHDSKGAADKEPQRELLSEDAACDGEAGKDCQIVEKEAMVESEDGNISSLHSAPNSQNVNSDSGLSVGSPNPKDGVKDDSKFLHSPFNCDNKSSYSSVCPTGRISFKLYDWNPAEFPRRLRHQIFEWLASMPVELEGYVRPGCTILTAFLSMPTFMWAKLFEDPVSYVHDFVITPGKMLSKRSPMLVYLNNMIFRVMQDGNSVLKVNLEGQAPRLHYVHPSCFEAGKPIEFVACGSNLLQPKFRLLVSFAGKYLKYDYCVALPRGPTEGCSSLDHQLCKIYIPHVDPNVFGPAFIEVENESGLSNFIPVLIGNEEICSEMERIQHRLDSSQQKHMDSASNILQQKVKQSDDVDERDFRGCSESDMPSVASFNNEDLEKSSNGKLGIMENSSAVVKSDRIPLLSKDVVMNVNLSKERPNKSCSLVFSNRLMKSRPAIFLIATFTICLGVCAILVHPNQVSKFAVSIRRCLTDRF
ncbi:hypothetical protein MANES_03G189400v8 [Manihot esculenta]|uniref:SBP-type domain-containing protein n=1 Tax=Manihot esculenta TaxID=3983 RepID=A0A2C9WAH4_MANES|nr:hypothetical protein MANES_03G189400v8 [Manihot esculenta]